MGMANIFQTGKTGMMSSKAGIATTGHNITNANTEGYSRQRVQTEAQPGYEAKGAKAIIGNGTLIGRAERFNDKYIEKQLRAGTRDLAHFEEKELVLKQAEDVFNEMNGEGLNRLMSRFFNEFRRLSNEPDNEAVRQSVREASQAMLSDMKRLRTEITGIARLADSRIEGYTREFNAYAEEIKTLNMRIRQLELGGAEANDLRDKRDLVLKKLASYADLNMHQDKEGNFVVELHGIGPVVTGPNVEKLSVETSPADAEGKPEGAFDVRSSSSANSIVTHRLKGGKFGALLDARDKTLSTILGRLDELAFGVSKAVNSIHQQGYNRYGVQGTDFFKDLQSVDRAAEYLDLSDAVKNNVNSIATAAIPDAPGDNRIAVAIANVQHANIMNEGMASADAFYNSIISDVGVAASKTRFGMTQQKDIMTQLSKMRDQISGVSIDEETANLMQFQHTFDASAKVIQVADEMLRTVLEIKR